MFRPSTMGTAALFGLAALGIAACSEHSSYNPSFSASPPNAPSTHSSSTGTPSNGEPVNPQTGTDNPARVPPGTGQ